MVNVTEREVGLRWTLATSARRDRIEIDLRHFYAANGLGLCRDVQITFEAHWVAFVFFGHTTNANSRILPSGGQNWAQS